MSRTQPMELLIADAIVAAMQTIGVAAPTSDWFSTPQVEEGLPPDALPKGTKELIYVQYVTTVAVPTENAGTQEHAMQANFRLWFAKNGDTTAAGARQVVRMGSDAFRALSAAEKSIQSISKYGLVFGDFRMREEQLHLGSWVGVLDVGVQFPKDHLNP